jgi:hypothetical protein
MCPLGAVGQGQGWQAGALCLSFSLLVVYKFHIFSKDHALLLWRLKGKSSQVPVAPACNPSYTGGRGGRIKV